MVVVRYEYMFIARAKHHAQSGFFSKWVIFSHDPNRIKFMIFYKDFATDSVSPSARNGIHGGSKYNVWSQNVCNRLIKIT